MTQPASQPMIVQGVQVDSKNEFFVAQALEKYGVAFTYQFEIAGGSERRGGQIIDFALWVPPKPIPLLINGEYWHRDEQKESFRIAQIKRLLPDWDEVVILWGDETDTPEEAQINVLQKVLHGVTY